MKESTLVLYDDAEIARDGGLEALGHRVGVPTVIQGNRVTWNTSFRLRLNGNI